MRLHRIFPLGSCVGVILLAMTSTAWPQTEDLPVQPTDGTEEHSAEGNAPEASIAELRAALTAGEEAEYFLRQDMALLVLGIATRIDAVDNPVRASGYAVGLFAQTFPELGGAPVLWEFAIDEADTMDRDDTAQGADASQEPHFAEAISILERIAKLEEALAAGDLQQRETPVAGGETGSPVAPRSQPTPPSSSRPKLCPPPWAVVGRSLPTTRPDGTATASAGEVASDPARNLLETNLRKAHEELATHSDASTDIIRRLIQRRTAALARIAVWIELIEEREEAVPNIFGDLPLEGLGGSLRPDIASARDDVLGILAGHIRVTAVDDGRVYDPETLADDLIAIAAAGHDLAELRNSDILLEAEDTGGSLLEALEAAQKELNAASTSLAWYIAAHAGDTRAELAPAKDDAESDATSTPRDRPAPQSPASLTPAPSCIPNLNGSWAHVRNRQDGGLASSPVPCGALLQLRQGNNDPERLSGIYVQFVPEISDAALQEHPEQARLLNARIAAYQQSGVAAGNTLACLPAAVSIMSGGIEANVVNLDTSTDERLLHFNVARQGQFLLLEAHDQAGESFDPKVLFAMLGSGLTLCKVPIRALPDTASSAERDAVQALKRFQDESCVSQGK